MLIIHVAGLQYFYKFRFGIYKKNEKEHTMKLHLFIVPVNITNLFSTL